ncbi:zinc-binding dehydrogenase [Deinococcus peraridilitoris]|uniref:Theronine dehydrogenase-like Zn-dependent dehydrogenase n=1 Tax=Deinococcus peraridilitoris (strain DSM 19664 / LMG 22246 / CIP 109416 / KR-200) TaxID=937777 RepID=L0A148_DEIPD|nr:zinc-binding dehydrogenase [Deinococcus peraridilitoris]AFZ66912.1 theronine dehydrogenase-like Zn-dependent dehydrogenase [Deinococcus peraridilitoris DSM 19664]
MTTLSSETMVFRAPREIAFEPEPLAPLKPNEVRVRTLFSGISAGTEITAYRGSNPYLHKRWDPEYRLFRPGAEPTHTYPLRGWGYEEVGEVTELGSAVRDLQVGTHVFGTWGHRTHAVLPAGTAIPRQMPGTLEPILGIFSRIGSIALNGIHDGRIRLGESVAVFGLGVLGQIVAQSAKRSGATVIGVDLHASRLDLALKLGIDQVIDASTAQAAEAIKDLTGGRGADVCFEVTGAPSALNEAIRAAAYSARVVAMGFIPGEARGLFLGEEFHHNRINVVSSQIYGPDPELKYRWDDLRLAQTAMHLQAQGWWDLKPLISHVQPYREAAALFDTLDRHPQDAMQAVLDFQDA